MMLSLWECAMGQLMRQASALTRERGRHPSSRLVNRDAISYSRNANYFYRS